MMKKKRMFSSELPYFIGLTLIIFFTPFLPTRGLILLDHFILRVLMLLVLLYALQIGPTVTIFCFVAIAVLYVERNRRKVQIALDKLDAMEVPKYATVEEAHRPQTTVHVRSFDSPSEKDTFFSPQEEPYDITHFEPVAPTLNEKVVFPSIYEEGSAQHAASLYEDMGVGHVNGVETLGEIA